MENKVAHCKSISWQPEMSFQSFQSISKIIKTTYAGIETLKILTNFNGDSGLDHLFGNGLSNSAALLFRPAVGGRRLLSFIFLPRLAVTMI